jgi:hypothetical protein
MEDKPNKVSNILNLHDGHDQTSKMLLFNICFSKEYRRANSYLLQKHSEQLVSQNLKDTLKFEEAAWTYFIF